MKSVKGRVLILDDELDVGRSIALLAEHFELESRAVTTPKAFFSTLVEWNPTHIILDLVMPEMDGVQVLQELAQLSCRARIAISSGVGNRVLNAAHRSGAEHGLDIASVLPKPFTVAALREFLLSSPMAPAVKTVSRPNDRGGATITSEDLVAAIDEKHFRLVYQPKVHCTTRVVKGFEALIRWDHPIKGPVMPDQFIQLSENLDLIGPITSQVVDLAINWYSNLERTSGLSISVNISAKTLGDLKFVDLLEGKCRDTGISPEAVILEVTETAAMDDQLLALDMFTRLRMKCFQVSIDDFGIGNSSLALLARLPFSEIKVDRSFAMSATKSEESRAIIKSTVDLSHSLDLTVVTEGVEDRETLDFLQEIGCDLAQGYYIARPMPGDAVVEWMLQRRESTRHNML